MLLQTNSYIVPKDRRAEHARLMRRFRQVLAKLGCDNFEVYEQVGANWGAATDANGRFVQIMRFRDRKHQLAVQNAERNDPAAQACIAEFCELVNFQYQQQQGFFAVGFYNSALPVAPSRAKPTAPADPDEAAAEAAVAADNDGAVEEQAAPAAAYAPPAEGVAEQPQQEEPLEPEPTEPVASQEEPAPIEATIEEPTPETIVDHGPPIDLTGHTADTTEAPLSEDELLGEMTHDNGQTPAHVEHEQPHVIEHATVEGELIETGDYLETGEIIETGEVHDAHHEVIDATPPAPAAEEPTPEPPPAEERRSLFRRSRRS